VHLSDFHSPVVATVFRTIDESKVGRRVQNKTLLKSTKNHTNYDLIAIQGCKQSTKITSLFWTTLYIIVLLILFYWYCDNCTHSMSFYAARLICHRLFVPPMYSTQSWTWVHFAKSNPTQSTSWLIQSNPIQSNPIQSNPLYPAVAKTLSIAIQKIFFVIDLICTVNKITYYKQKPQ